MIYNFILERIILRIGGLILRNSFIKTLNILRTYEHKSEEQLKQLEKNKLYHLLKLATTKTSYYSKFRENENKNPHEWLKVFPVIGKDEINKQGLKMLTMPKKELLPQKSSGSSGIQTTTYWSKRDQDYVRATQILWWEWAGYRIGDPILQTGIGVKRSPLKKMKDLVFRTRYILAFNHEENEMLNALYWAQKQKNPVLAGYASSIYIIATIALKYNVKVKFKTAVAFGDKMFAHYKKAIKGAFDCNVYETYGSAEGVMLGGQKDLDYMYMMTPNTVIELLDDQGDPVKDGEMGHVVVTNLNSHAMPLIRYRIGDLAIKLPEKEYPPKRELSLPLFKKVIGRDTDIVKTPKGKTLIVHSFTGVFEYISEVKQFAVVQDVISVITIKYIPNDNFRPEILNQIRNKIIDLIKEDLTIKFEEVKFIPPTPSGKPQIIISNLKKNN